MNVCVYDTNQNRQLFTPGQQKRGAGPVTEAFLKVLVSSVEEVQRSEGQRGVGTEGKLSYGADVRGQK